MHSGWASCPAAVVTFWICFSVPAFWTPACSIIQHVWVAGCGACSCNDRLLGVLPPPDVTMRETYSSDACAVVFLQAGTDRCIAKHMLGAVLEVFKLVGRTLQNAHLLIREKVHAPLVVQSRCAGWRSRLLSPAAPLPAAHAVPLMQRASMPEPRLAAPPVAHRMPCPQALRHAQALAEGPRASACRPEWHRGRGGAAGRSAAPARGGRRGRRRRPDALLAAGARRALSTPPPAAARPPAWRARPRTRSRT